MAREDRTGRMASLVSHRLEAWFGIERLTERHEIALLSAGLAFLAMVFLGPLMTGYDVIQTGDEGNGFRQGGYLAIFALTLYGARPLANGWKVLRVPLPVVVALAWCWISLSWAVSPAIAERRLVLTSLVVWNSFILVKAAGYRLTVSILRLSLVMALIGNFLVVLILPETGIHMMKDAVIQTALAGDWRGFMTHKNFAGAACALCILLFTFDTKYLSKASRISVILASIFFLVKAQSKTSAGMVILAISVGFMFKIMDGKIRFFAIIGTALLATLGWMYISASRDVTTMDFLDPSSFTGRGLIWSSLLKFARDNLMTGAGFESFWNIGDQSPIYQYGKGYVTQITVGHNGYLDLLVTIGLPGMLLVTFALILWPLLRLLAARGIAPERGALICALVIFGMGHNVTESSMFARDAIVGVFMLFAVAFAQDASGSSRRRPANQDSADVLHTIKRRHSNKAKPAAI
ncbi:MAG: O-antigen ligase family protein [Pseudomonadota bacterium]|nr:O-antigen ligase family protein [Pseudomonadota bacterium]